ncbi:MAG: 4-hydroxy-tetrahydrodipicolinate reductase [Lachnospiraceae bacterium]|nr:4-hydroxy-tetrahydrodipicolinate reductase [Lachnospiraceae bacterium]MCI1658090.1 4-hydroxy-tetrahydrodipicolinate reductase [Lachnospiraceae bacterium]MCI2196430.1 4-hydroxy-tetrahydrodipicolinate reductase [Lachnospiraceae bacterium]HAD19293.1 4-hydroxy-tetrahydrodipicolinate reductase [Lachnospiraceae bacterium]
MTRIIMNGCNGHMGQVIAGLCQEDPDTEIVAGIDISGEAQNGFPVFRTIAECDAEADAIIDFSHVSCIDSLLAYSAEKQIPVVVCTTGLSKEQEDLVTETAKKVAVLKSANMSLGVNTLMALLKTAARTLAPAGFDMEIVEKHHHRKLDAPSGTALALAASMNEALDNAYEYKLDRSRERKARDPHEIGIQAVRGGNIVGEHEVIFAGMDEVITFKHTAYSRAIFGKGAIEAAKFLKGKPAGYYDMSDVIAARS